MSKPAITIIENLRARSICETKSRYDIYLHGVKFTQLYFNMTGYCGVLPLPDNQSLSMPECSIRKFKLEISKINKEFAKTLKS